jgi:hypothetical protein
MAFIFLILTYGKEFVMQKLGVANEVQLALLQLIKGQ